MIIYEQKTRWSSNNWKDNCYILINLDTAFRMYQRKIKNFKGNVCAKKSTFGDFINHLYILGYRIQ